MAWYTFIPLVAACAHIALVVIVLGCGARQRQHRYFLGFLAVVICWTGISFIALADFFPERIALFSQLVVISVILAVVFYYRFLRALAASEDSYIEKFVLLIFGLVFAVLVFLGYMVQGVTSEGGIPQIQYKPPILAFALGSVALLSLGSSSLIRKYRRLHEPRERNQLMYLLVGLGLIVLFTFTSLLQPFTKYPLVHLGTLANSLVITYAIVRHRLLDIRVVARRGLAYTVLGIGTAALSASLLFGLSRLAHLNAPAITIAGGTVVALLVGVLFYLLSKPFQRRIERFFLGSAYLFRRKLGRFASEMSPVLDLNELLDGLLTLVIKGLKAEKALLLIRNQSGDFTSTWKTDGHQLELKRDHPLLSYLQNNNGPLYSEQLDILPQMKALWEKERKELSSLNFEAFFPIKNHGQLIAILCLGKRQRGKYPLEDVQLLEKATTEAGVLIGNALLFEETQLRARRAALLAELGRIITSNLNFKKSFQAFARSLGQELGAGWIGIAIIEEQDKMKLRTLFTNQKQSWKEEESIPLAGTATQWMLVYRKLLYEPDLAEEREFWTDEIFFKDGFRSIVRLPLYSKGEVIGIFIVAASQPRAFGLPDLEFLGEVSGQLSLALQNARLYELTQQKAITDALTGLYNHRHFHERLEEEISRSLRYNRPFSIVMLDLDFFKYYNDAYGHLAGDQALKQVADVIRSSTRKSDTAFRYGGEEFALILPETKLYDAFEVAERIRERVQQEAKVNGMPLTVSLGVATWSNSSRTKESLLQAADTALYKAKRAGRNRTYMAAEDLGVASSTAILTPSYEERQQPSLQLLRALVTAMEARDQYTLMHSQKVAEYALNLAREMNLPGECREALHIAALLHDIGKIGIPERILKKPDRLAKGEWEAIKAHPAIGVDILRHLDVLSHILPIVLHHHEHYDGSGYPHGLKGKEIPIEARILAVADAYEAMTAPRPYRNAHPSHAALEQLQLQAGKQFDPEVVEAFLRVIQRSLVA